MARPTHRHTTAPPRSGRRTRRRLGRRTTLALAAGLVLLLAACDLGKPGPTYVQASDPTISKPESKLWFKDGTWWGAMLETGTPSSSGTPDANVTIFRLDPDGWVDTGVLIDSRGTTKTDVVASGDNLWTVAHKHTGNATGVAETLDSNKTKINRFTYSSVAHAYVPVAGYPKVLNDFSMESITMDVDSTGALWVAWVQAQHPYWQRSTDGGATWSAPAAVPGLHTTTTSDDIASLVAFGTKVGIMWSNQAVADAGFWFTTAAAGAGPVTWSAPEAAYVGAGLADDHVNLKANGDTVYAAVKTGLNTGANPEVVLLQRTPAGAWSGRTAWIGSDNVTRPVVQLDVTHGNALVFVTGPNAPGGDGELGGAVYEKVVPLAAGDFPSGLGTKVMARGDTGTINDVTGSKAPVTSASGLVMLAADSTTTQYWYLVDPLTP